MRKVVIISLLVSILSACGESNSPIDVNNDNTNSSDNGVVTPSPFTPPPFTPTPSDPYPIEPGATPEPQNTPNPITQPNPGSTPQPIATPSGPTTPAPTNPLPPTHDLVLGEAWYISNELKCSACHSNDGRSNDYPDLVGEDFLANYDFDSLMLKVLFMSEKYGTISCDGKEPGTCGYEVAAYIWVKLNNQTLENNADDGKNGNDDSLASSCRIQKNSGMRRLTKTEMKHAIEDTFGLSADAYDELPKERNLGGFESIGAVQSSDVNFVIPLLDTSINTASRIVNNSLFTHNCTDNQLSSCISETLRPFAQKLSGLGPNEVEVLLERVSRFALTTAQSQAPEPTPQRPSGDQCNTTGECKTLFGNDADDCVNSPSNQSFCSCGGERCDVLNPGIFNPIVNTNIDHINAGFEDGLVALIMSPEFLYLKARQSDQARVLNSHEIAKTLSLTLWLSVPDDILLDAANKGLLSTQEQIAAHIDRMMSDEKFSRFKEHFFNQWLGFSRVSSYDVNDDALNILNWDAIANDMTQESLRFMNYLLENNLHVNEILTADYSFLNARLAQHYGISGISHNEFEKVTLPDDSNRQGLITQGAILTRAANGDHASVVIRGETLLSGLMCDPPASPDATIQNEIDELANAQLSEYEKMLARDQKPNCAACHSTMDPVGWAFTGFDAAARPLIDDANGIINNGTIDPSGIYKDNFYNGPLDMINLLNEQNNLEMCLSEKFMIYTLGRPVSYLSNAEDNCIIDEVITNLRATLDPDDNQIKMKDLIKAVLIHDVNRLQGDKLQ